MSTATDSLRYLGPRVIHCRECGHGIDPHGVDPGGICGVGDAQGNLCQCYMSPNGIACQLQDEMVPGVLEQVTVMYPATWRHSLTALAGKVAGGLAGVGLVQWLFLDEFTSGWLATGLTLGVLMWLPEGVAGPVIARRRCKGPLS